MNICPGESQLFSHTNTGNPTITEYQWYRVGPDTLTNTVAPTPGELTLNSTELGFYEVYAVSDQGCVSDSIEVFMGQFSTGSYELQASKTTVCEEDTTTIFVNNPGSNSYYWLLRAPATAADTATQALVQGFGSGPISWQTQPIFGDSTYILWVVDENGCVVDPADSVTINHVVAPTFAFNMAAEQGCDSVQITIDEEDTYTNNPFYDMVWTVDGGAINPADTSWGKFDNFYTTASGEYILSVTELFSIAQCNWQDTADIFVSLPPTFDTPDTVVCGGTSETYTSDSLVNWTILSGPATISGGAPATPQNSVTIDFNAVTAKDSVIIEITSSALACPDTVRIFVLPDPVFSFVAPFSACDSVQVQLDQTGVYSANPSFDFAWEFDAQGAPVNFTPYTPPAAGAIDDFFTTQSGDYRLTITYDTLGQACAITNTQFYDPVPSPTFLSPDTVVCTNSGSSLDASTAVNWAILSGPGSFSGGAPGAPVSTVSIDYGNVTSTDSVVVEISTPTLGCADTVRIYVLPEPDFSFVAPFSACDSVQVQLDQTGVYSANPSFNFAWELDAQGAPVNFTPYTPPAAGAIDDFFTSQSGDYRLTITYDTLGQACAITNTQFYDAVDAPEFVNPNTVFCSDPAIETYTADESVTWSIVSGPATINSTTATTADIDFGAVTSNDSVIIRIENGLGCTRDLTVHLLPFPEFTFNAPYASCDSVLVELTPENYADNSNYTFVWERDLPGAPVNFQPYTPPAAADIDSFYVSNSADFQLTVSYDSLGQSCPTTRTQFYDAVGSPTLVAPDTLACEGSSVSYTAAGGAALFWEVLSGPATVNTPATGVSDATATIDFDPVLNDQPVVIEITADDATGCTNTYTIRNLMAPEFSFTGGDFCDEADVVLDSLGIYSGLAPVYTGDYTFNWSRDVTGTGNFVAFTPTGTPDDFTITQGGAYELELLRVYPDAGTSPNQTCTFTNTATFNIENTPVILGDTTVCDNSVETYTSQGGVSGTWTIQNGPAVFDLPGSPTSTTGTSADISYPNLPGAADVVTLNLETGTLGCNSTVTIDVEPRPDFSIDNAAGGINECGSATITVTGPDPATNTYSWSPIDPVALGWGTADDFTIPNAGTYNLTLTVTGANGCASSESVVVTVIQEPQFVAPKSPVCPGDVEEIGTLLAPGTFSVISGQEFVESIGPGVADNVAEVVYAEGPGGGQVVFQFISETVPACTTTTTVDIAQSPIFDLPTQFYCPGLSLFVDPADELSDYTIQTTHWFEAGNINNSLTFEPVLEINPENAAFPPPYALRVTSINGCQYTDTFDVVPVERPVISAIPTRAACYGDAVTFDAELLNPNPSNPGQFVWINQFNDTAFTNTPDEDLTIDPLTRNETYTVRYEGSVCPSDTVITSVLVASTPVAAGFTTPNLPFDFRDPDMNIVMETQTQFHWGDGNLYPNVDPDTTDAPVHTWAFLDDGPLLDGEMVPYTFDPERNTWELWHTVSATTGDLTCSDSVFIGEVEVYEREFLNIPNVFSPNQDGINDDFILEVAALESVTVTIFDRHGVLHQPERRFDVRDRNTVPVWDGNSQNGEQAPEGVYMYVIQVETIWGTQSKRSGTLTLLR